MDTDAGGESIGTGAGVEGAKIVVPIPVADAGDPRLDPFRDLKDRQARLTGTIVVDSERVVRRMLARGHDLTGLLATPEGLRRLERKHLLRQRIASADGPFFVAGREVMESVIGFRLHHGMVALGRRPADQPAAQFGPRIVILNGVNNAENVGSIVRSCHAFGVDTLVVDRASCSPWVRRAIRVSMGSVFALGIHHCADVTPILEDLSRRGYPLWGAANDPQARVPRPGAAPPEWALIIGSEATGLSPGVRPLCRQLLRIPVREDIDSLNAGVAAGILLWALTGGA